MIATGAYHRDPVGDTDAAEVALLVEDSQQGRGLGSILLEHLAAAARERGISRFTAAVLSQNTKMLGCSSMPVTPSAGSTPRVLSTWCSTSRRPRSPGR